MNAGEHGCAPQLRVKAFTMQVFYGNIIHSIDKDSLQFLTPGCLIVRQGTITHLYSGEEASIEFTNLKNDTSHNVRSSC